MADKLETFQSIWGNRLRVANDYYRKWTTLFLCDKLEDYYEGRQWRNVDPIYRPYVINFYYSTIKIKLANMLFAQPKFELSPKPGAMDYDQEFAIKTTQVKQDVLNTIIANPSALFKEELELAFLESMVRFGMIEVGYSADWIVNPNVIEPLMKSEEKLEVSIEDDKIVASTLEEVPSNEQIYFKRIHANRFRVSGNDSEHLSRCNWVGYFDFVERKVLYNTPGIKNKDEILSGGSNSTGSYDDYLDYSDRSIDYGNDSDIVKIWHIWNQKTKKRLLILDSPTTELWSKPYDRLPLLDLRWDVRLTGYYPMPPAFQWLSPQNEINEAREQLRSYRKRFSPKFQILENGVDDEELDKFNNGPSGTGVMVKREGAIQPIQQPNLGTANPQMMLVSKDDLNIVSGTSSEQRGKADRTTATQAVIVDKKGQIREDFDLGRALFWMSRIGRESLLLMSDKFVFGTWAEMTSDITENFLGEVEDKGPVYKYIMGEDLKDGYDFKISVDIVSMSPVKAEEEKKKFLEFLAVVNNYPQISLSPKLIREAAFRTGYRNESVIKEMQNMAILTMLGKQQEAGMQSGLQGQGNAFAQRAVAQATPNTQEQISNQLNNQGLG